MTTGLSILPKPLTPEEVRAAKEWVQNTLITIDKMRPSVRQFAAFELSEFARGLSNGPQKRAIAKVLANALRQITE